MFKKIFNKIHQDICSHNHQIINNVKYYQEHSLYLQEITYICDSCGHVSIRCDIQDEPFQNEIYPIITVSFNHPNSK